MEVADTSAEAVEMVKQQQAEPIWWSSSSSALMSLGMLSPLGVAVPTRLAVRGAVAPRTLASHLRRV